MSKDVHGFTLRSEENIGRCSSDTIFLDTGSPIGLELSEKARLAGYQDPGIGIHWSLPHKHWDCKHKVACLCFYVGSGD